jgi:hypothetical protein
MHSLGQIKAGAPAHGACLRIRTSTGICLGKPLKTFAPDLLSSSPLLLSEQAAETGASDIRML